MSDTTVTCMDEDDRSRPFVVLVGLHGVCFLNTMKIDHALVTALVVPWCKKTNTFYLSVGKAT